jgi:hypothetical protein
MSSIPSTTSSSAGLIATDVPRVRKFGRPFVGYGSFFADPAALDAN